MKRPVPIQHVLWVIPVLGLLLVAAWAGYTHVRRGLPVPEEIVRFQPPASTRVLDCRGRIVYEFFQEKRHPVALDVIPDYLKFAVVAVEDRRFYRHWGIDLARLPGLLWAMLQNRGKIRGTSTITQQLARSVFLTYERSLDRKLKEMVLAIEFERHFSKDEILEMYLNQVWFGGSTYGVEAAAERYFGKHVSQLDLAECASLAALITNPAVYSPHQHPERLRERRNLFLRKLHQSGRITMEQFQTARQQPLATYRASSGQNVAPYFVEEIRRDLIARYGPDFVYRSGATIYSTLDLDLQEAANRAVEERLAEIEADYLLRHPKTWFDSLSAVDSTYREPDYLQGALVAIENTTGFVRALVGGRDFGQSEFNRATQAPRQPGSAFKPFLYAAALDNGFTAADIVVDSTIVLTIPGQPEYQPLNYDRKMLGPVTLRRALALSRNLVAVRLIARLGPELVARYANLLGIDPKLLPVYSLALGSVEVALLDITAAFATLPNLGVRVSPILIERIKDARGFVVEENAPEPRRVIRPATAYVLTSMMQSVVDEGTASAIRQLGFTGPAAGKTGTTDDYTDAWFVGFTPELSCGVWVGYDQLRTIFRGATGGSVAAPIWARFVSSVRPDSASPRFSIPDSIVTAPVCEQSGALATPDCPRVRYEVFVTGTPPQAACRLHGPSGLTQPPTPDTARPAPNSLPPSPDR